MTDMDEKGRRRVMRGDLYRGALVTWLHKPRGGYGFVMPIGATVLAVRQKVAIVVTTADGREVSRMVDAENLRWGSP